MVGLSLRPVHQVALFLTDFFNLYNKKNLRKEGNRSFHNVKHFAQFLVSTLRHFALKCDE
jgi:hypothetical protein